MNLKRIFSIAIVMLAALPAMGFCFDVTAHVDKTRISRDDSLFLTVEVNGGKADLDLSRIKDFKVISRGSSSSYNYRNGKSERKATYTYALVPLAKGELIIPAIKAARDGETAFSQEIVIQVIDQTVSSDDVKALFARAEVTDNSLFTGEQAVYTLTFFTSKRLSGLGFERPPEFKAFSSKPFEKEKTYSRTINGILYHLTQVNYLITPASPGTFTIDPAVLVANVMVKSKRDPRFDSFFSSNSYKPVRVVSNPVKIEVSPLPLYKGPGAFSGLVGQFDIEGIMDQTQLKAGESATLTIRISGSGNIMDAGLPEMDLPGDAFKVYDDTPVETIHLTDAGYEGVKEFKKAIVPVSSGKYVIPAISLTYFDVDQKAYQTVLTNEIWLDVTPSEELHQAVKPIGQPADNPIVKQEVSLVNKDILEIKEGLDVLKDYREIEPLFFALFLLIPAVLFSGVKLFVMVSKRDVSVEKAMEEKAKYHFKQAWKMQPGDQGFLSHLYSALVALIFAKAKKKGETVTVSEAQTILATADVEVGQIDQITRLLETIESVRFGGNRLDENKASELLSKTKEMMKLICLAVVCLGLFSFSPRTAAANIATTFTDGIKSYKAGHFEQAAMAFEKIAKRPVKNPWLFYNIANAYLKAGDIGQAILWYERAKSLAPNDPDLKFNLAYANTLVKDKKEGEIKIMDILFFWDSLISNKTIQITAIFFSFLSFAWASVRVLKKRKVFSGFGILLCSVAVLLITITCITYYKQSIQLNAVIVQEEVAVRSGMTETSTQLFSLHAGSKVRVEEQRPGYLKIVFSKNKVGWVKSNEALII